jgi:GNAT superfamily N-acetyltransferase
MEKVRIEFEPLIDEAARQFIVNGVDNYNIAATSLPDYFPVNFVLRGERGDVLGGVLGQLWGGWLQVTYLWVAEAARGTGNGTRLIRMLRHTLALGVPSGRRWRRTVSRPFHERLGYEVVGTLDGYPPGHVKFFLKKAFA